MKMILLIRQSLIDYVFFKVYVSYFNPDEVAFENIAYANSGKDLKVTNIILDKNSQQKEKINESKYGLKFINAILGFHYFL